MMFRRYGLPERTAVGILAGLTGPLLAFPAYPAPLDAPQAIDLLTNTADRICNVVSTKGTTQSSEVKGEVKAQLSGLASKLADVGVSGSGSLNNDEYQNVIRQDLAQTLRDNATCKLKVFETLQTKLLAASAAPVPEPTPPKVTNADLGLAANGSLVGRNTRFILQMYGSVVLQGPPNVTFALTGGSTALAQVNVGGTAHSMLIGEHVNVNAACFLWLYAVADSHWDFEYNCT
jgi:hypothetical protein